jgi:polyisoprenyl-teichoic acid--peptidoglycan teichoic acid transferase
MTGAVPTSRSPRATLRAFTRRYVIALGVALVFTVGGVVSANIAIDQKFDQISRVEVNLASSDPGTPGNFLLIGSDSRAPAGTPEEEAALASEDQPASQRSDTIMIVHVDPGYRSSVVVSLPRDLWVDIPGRGEAKINAAFNEGPQKVIDTLQADFGIPINHYMAVDFATFEGIVDAIGRVPVYLPAKARDFKTGFSVPDPGCYQLDGKQALQYVRSRYLQYYDPETRQWNYADAVPDLGRIGRQQNFIRSIGSLAYRAALGNPLKADEIADNVVQKLVVDSALTRSEVFKLVNTFRTVDPADPGAIEMLTVPTYGSTSDDGQSILLLDDPDAETVLARLRTFGEAPAPSTGILPPQVRVRVLNGSGVEGLAWTTLDALQRQFGFAGAGLGNAADTPMTEIRYRPGLEKAGRLVKRYFGGVGKLIEDAGVAKADVVVVLGPDFSAVSAPPGVAPAATSWTPTTVPTEVTSSPGVVPPEHGKQAEAYIRAVQRKLQESSCEQ